MAKVTIQYWAAAREAAGTAAESVEAGTLAEALDMIVARRGDGERLRSVLAVSSFLVDGAPAGRRLPADLVLPEAARIEVLPRPPRPPSGGPPRGPPAGRGGRGGGGGPPPPPPPPRNGRKEPDSYGLGNLWVLRHTG